MRLLRLEVIILPQQPIFFTPFHIGHIENIQRPINTHTNSLTEGLGGPSYIGSQNPRITVLKKKKKDQKKKNNKHSTDASAAGWGMPLYGN